MDFWPGFKNYKVQRSFKESIEPEEVLLDAQKSVDLLDQRFEIPIKKRVFLSFFGAILITIIILIFQTGYFQITKNENYLVLAKRNSLRIYPVLAPRGLIYDKNLKPLVNNLPSFDVLLTPQDLPKNKIERDNAIEQICFLLDLELKKVNEELINFDFEKNQRILLASSLAPEKILELESRKDNFPYLTIEKSIIRQYPLSEAASHILGYTGRLTQKEVELFPDYFLIERIGKNGLEASYEEILRGQAGEKQVEVDSLGERIKELGIKEELAGQNIVTTIDSDLQEKIFQAISQKLKDLHLTKAAAVALDPNNGHILAMTSFPSFDSNVFEQNTLPEELDKILKDSDKPLFNRVVSGQYPSGSTIKPLLGAAALEEKIVTPSTTIFDSGNISIINQYNPNVIYNFPDWKAHGVVNIYSAIAQSCNVYFYTIGGGYGGIEGLGVERIKKYLELFGLGVKSGIDFISEEAGLIPDPEWKEKTKNEAWFIGDTYHVSIGQGDLLVTPLQMANAIASIANGGKLFVPRLVDKIVDSDKNNIKVFEPQILKENFISVQNLAVIRKGMREAVTSGSARFLDDLSVKVAGKTGTAQVAGQERENAWFVGFAPYDNPKIVLAIMLEDAGEGSSVAVPIAKEIFNWYFK